MMLGSYGNRIFVFVRHYYSDASLGLALRANQKARIHHVRGFSSFIVYSSIQRFTLYPSFYRSIPAFTMQYSIPSIGCVWPIFLFLARALAAKTLDVFLIDGQEGQRDWTIPILELSEKNRLSES